MCDAPEFLLVFGEVTIWIVKRTRTDGPKFVVVLAHSSEQLVDWKASAVVLWPPPRQSHAFRRLPHLCNYGCEPADVCFPLPLPLAFAFAFGTSWAYGVPECHGMAEKATDDDDDDGG